MPSFRSRPEFEQFGYQFQNILKLQKALTSRKDGSLDKWFFSNTQFLSGKYFMEISICNQFATKILKKEVMYLSFLND